MTSVLFDPPTRPGSRYGDALGIADKSQTDPDDGIEKFRGEKDPSAVSSAYPWLLRAFLASNLVQYLLIFLAVPFSDVENRPPVFVLSCLLGSLSFILSALMLPAGLVHVPTALSHVCSAATLAVKTVEVGVNVASVVACLNADAPMLEYHVDSRTHLFVPLDITAYIQVVCVLLLAAAAVSMALALIIYLFNCVHRRRTG